MYKNVRIQNVSIYLAIDSKYVHRFLDKIC